MPVDLATLTHEQLSGLLQHAQAEVSLYENQVHNLTACDYKELDYWLYKVKDYKTELRRRQYDV